MHSTLDPNLAAIDREALIDRMMGSVEMANRMVSMFIHNAADEADEIESIIRIGQRDQVASAAHRHKGTARTLATERVAFWAEKIEEAAGSDSTAELLSMLRCLREEHERLRREFETEDVQNDTHDSTRGQK